MDLMNYYGAKELAASFRTVRKNTIVIAKEIPEEQYGFRPSPESRTVAQTLVHIALASKLQEQVHRVEKRTTLEGFDFMGFIMPLIAQEQTPGTKAEVVAFLEERGEDFATWLDTLWDEFLAERVSMMPGMQPSSKTRFEMILGVKEHEMHHRGQLMLMERMLGVVPHLTREMQARFATMTQAVAVQATA